MANQVKNIDGVLLARIKNFLGLADANIKNINGLEFAQTIPDTITAGTAYAFNYGIDSNTISVTMLTSTKVIAVYRDVGNSYYQTAIILNISTDTITKGTAYVFVSSTVDYVSIVTLSATKVLATYNGASGKGTAIILNISTDTITSGTPYEYEAGSTSYISAVALSTTKVMVTYTDGGNNNYGTSIILNISTDTITAGTAYVYNSSITSSASVVMLSSTKALVAYKDGGNSSYGTAVTLNVSTDTITKGTAYVFESAATTYISAVALSATKILVTYKDGGNSSYGTSIILNVSSDTVTSGTAFVFESANTDYISTIMLSSTKVLTSYRDGGNSNYGTAIILNVNSDTITSGIAFVFENANTVYISAVMLSSIKVLIGYSDLGNSGSGTSIILNISA